MWALSQICKSVNNIDPIGNGSSRLFQMKYPQWNRITGRARNKEKEATMVCVRLQAQQLLHGVVVKQSRRE